MFAKFPETKATYSERRVGHLFVIRQQAVGRWSLRVWRASSGPPIYSVVVSGGKSAVEAAARAWAPKGGSKAKSSKAKSSKPAKCVCHG